MPGKVVLVYPKLRRAVLVTASCMLVMAGSGTAMAEICEEAVQALAEHYGLDVDPPNAEAPGRSNSTFQEELADSGGVIEPPATGDSVVIEPPNTSRFKMPTAPDITPPSPGKMPSRRQDLSAADLAMLEAMLTAARAEAKRDQSEDCFRQLGEAREFLAERAH